MKTANTESLITQLLDSTTKFNLDRTESFIKIPIKNYEDLSCFQSNIIKAISLVGNSKLKTDSDDLGFVLENLCLILEQTILWEESTAIDNIQDEIKKVKK